MTTPEKRRSDLGQPHDRQPKTGLFGIYYNEPNHAIQLAVRVGDGTHFSRQRALSAHELPDAVEQLLAERDGFLAAHGRELSTPDDWVQYRAFRRELAA